MFILSLVSSNILAQCVTVGSDVTICQGSSVPNLGGTALNGTTLVQWTDNGAGGTFSNFNDLHSSWTPLPSYTGTATLTLMAIAGCTDIQTTASLKVTVSAPVTPMVTISANPSGPICAGTSVIFTPVAVNGGASPSYQWKVGSTVMGTGSSFTTSSLANGDVVSAVMTTSLTCVTTTTDISNLISMVVNPTVPVSVNIAAVPSGSICAGTTVAFTATPTNGGTPSYQWKLNGANVGTNSSTYSNSALADGDKVTVVMTATGISCPSVNPATSNQITMDVNPLPTPTLTSSDADHIICEGTSVTFTASGGTNYAFNVGGTTVQNGASTTYTTNALNNGQTVNVVVTNSFSCTATSAGIQFFVNALPFISQPSGLACAANLATYSFSVIVSAGTVTTTAGVAALTGTNTWTITVPAGQNTIVSVTNGGCVNSISVTAPNCSCPVIQPPVSGGDKSYCAGGTIPALTATVVTGETVDWYNVASGGTSLATGLSYTPTVPGTFYALARNTTTSCVSSSRTPIVLTANPLPTATIISSETDNTFCAGQSVTFTASGGTNYNFRVAGVSVQSGLLTAYTTTTLTNGQVVDVIVTNANGCVATSAGITNTVRALPTPTLTSSDADNTFCSGTSVVFTATGGTNYNFRVAGASVQNSATATYTTNTLTTGQVVDVIVTNANGCIATSAGITNTVNSLPVPLLTSSDADHAFCSGTAVTFTASTGSTNYNFRVGGITAQNGASNIFTTSTLTNGQIVDVIATNATGCSVTSAGITNVVSPQPIANGGAGGNVCNLSFKFSGVPSIGLGTWTKTTGPGVASFAPNANTANATVTVTEYGTYTFTWTEVSGACSSSSVVTVNFYLQPVANAGTGGNNCGLGFHFNATLNTGIGTWAKVSGPGNVIYSPDANTPNALVTVSAYGTYTFSWTVVNGTCSNSQNVNVIFIQQVPASGGPGGNECDKDFVLGAVLPSNGTGSWSKFAGPGNAVFTPDDHTINAKVTVDKFGAYDFAWTVVNSTCTSSDVVRVVFHDLPSINAGRDTTICKGNSVQLKALGTGTVSWTPATKLNNPNIINPVASPEATTTYTVNLTDQFGCKNSDALVVEVRDPIVADAGPDQELGYVLNTTMDATLAHDYEKGFWSLISGTGDLSDSTDAKSSVENLSIGLNEFLWTVSNGFCPVSHDTANIVVNDFVIPSMITPNMDGKNDYFELRGLTTLGQTELVIFNRKGAQVYKNSDYDNSWNGVDYNNNPLPEDTYFYVLKTSNGKSVSGYIVIRR